MKNYCYRSTWVAHYYYWVRSVHYYYSRWRKHCYYLGSGVHYYYSMQRIHYYYSEHGTHYYYSRWGIHYYYSEHDVHYCYSECNGHYCYSNWYNPHVQKSQLSREMASIHLSGRRNGYRPCELGSWRRHPPYGVDWDSRSEYRSRIVVVQESE